MYFGRLFETIVNRYLLPQACGACGRLLSHEDGTQVGRGLCGSCLSRLPLRPEQSLVFPVSTFQDRRPVPAAAVCFYKPPVPALMAQFKFHDAVYLARPFGELMATYLKRAFPEYRPDGLIPVPLHPLRERERGYNQAGELALIMSECLQLPLLNHVVKRSKETARQSEHDEPAERYANVAQAFCVVRPAAVYQQRLVLVDDVLTSGATLAALAEVLFEQGAADVRAMVFASGRAELVH